VLFFFHQVALQFAYFFLSLKDKIITKGGVLSDVSLRSVFLSSKRKCYAWSDCGRDKEKTSARLSPTALLVAFF